MSHVTHINEWCHIYEWVTSHLCMSHVTHTNESCHTYECFTSHIRMRIALASLVCLHMHESCHTYMSHTYMSHTYMSHTYMSHIHVTHIPVTHKHVTHKTCHTYISFTQRHEPCDTYEWVMSHARVRYESVTPRWHIIELRHTYMSPTCIPHTHIVWSMWYLWMSHVTRTSEIWISHTTLAYNWVTSHMHVTHIDTTHTYSMLSVIPMNESCHTNEWDMNQSHHVDI